MIHFAHPEILALLLLLPVLAFLRGRRGVASSLRYSSIEMLKNAGLPRQTALGPRLKAFRLLTLALLIVAMARPQFVKGFTEVEASGIDIILAIDVSSSMEALDFTLDGRPASRLDVVRKVVEEFIEARPNDRIGVVAFASRPYIASPLTLDHDWLLDRFKELHIGSVEDGTAVGSALAIASDKLREKEAKSKIVVLLTDGMNNAGKVAPLVAAEAAKALGIRVYTIGAGSRGEVPVPVRDAFGRKQLVRAKVDIDEDTLKEIARISGAVYFRATDTDSLERVYGEINKLEKTTQILKKYSSTTELFPVFAYIALFLLVVEQILIHFWYRRVP